MHDLETVHDNGDTIDDKLGARQSEHSTATHCSHVADDDLDECRAIHRWFD